VHCLQVLVTLSTAHSLFMSILNGKFEPASLANVMSAIVAVFSMFFFVMVRFLVLCSMLVDRCVISFGLGTLLKSHPWISFT
jgi:hypothetical protein